MKLQAKLIYKHTIISRQIIHDKANACLPAYPWLLYWHFKLEKQILIDFSRGGGTESMAGYTLSFLYFYKSFGPSIGLVTSENRIARNKYLHKKIRNNGRVLMA